MDAALSLERHGPLGRFDAPVEADYQRWLERHLLPLAVAMAFTSLAAWLTPPPIAHLLAKDDVDLSMVYLGCWGINVTALALGIAYLIRTGGDRVVLLGFLGIALTAIDSFLLLAPAIRIEASL